MSILPIPDPQPVEGIHLSALDAYAGLPGALPGIGFWPRVAARLIDLVVHYFFQICAGFLFGLLLAIAAGLRHVPVRALLVHHKPASFALFVFGLLGSVAFEAVCEGFHGSTPGKLVLSMVVVQEDGSPCRPGAAVVRSFAYFVDALFFGLIGYFSMQKNPQQQRHGDEWAHTVVCHRSDVRPENLRGAGKFVLALFFAAMADAALMLTGLLFRFLG